MRRLRRVHVLQRVLGIMGLMLLWMAFVFIVLMHDVMTFIMLMHGVMMFLLWLSD